MPLKSAGMKEVGRGMKVSDHAPIRGTWRTLKGPADVEGLIVSGAAGVVAVIRDPGATYLKPLYRELSAVICTHGTPGSHIGIVTREYQLPCIVAAQFPEGPPADGVEVEVDCSGDDGIVRA
jgi:hypothetical protein